MALALRALCALALALCVTAEPDLLAGLLPAKDAAASSSSSSLDALAATPAWAASLAKAGRLTLWTRNVNRTYIPAGGGGPGPAAGDQLVAWGDVFATAAADGAPVGTFDLTAVTTRVDAAAGVEAHQVMIEVALAKAYTADKLLQARRALAAGAGVGTGPTATDDLEIAGVDAYPLAGAVPNGPLTFAVTGGTGAFFGAGGQVRIARDPGTGVFRYDFVLL